MCVHVYICILFCVVLRTKDTLPEIVCVYTRIHIVRLFLFQLYTHPYFYFFAIFSLGTVDQGHSIHTYIFSFFARCCGPRTLYTHIHIFIFLAIFLLGAVDQGHSIHTYIFLFFFAIFLLGTVDQGHSAGDFPTGRVRSGAARVL